MNGVINGSATAPNTYSMITQVQSSDGRSVAYGYSMVATGGVSYYPVLGTVTYPDGSAAHYSYIQGVGGKRPVMSDVVDPRYPLPFTQMHMDYWDSTQGTHGAVKDQIAPGGQVMVVISSSNASTPTITAPNADGSTGTTSFNMNSGVPLTVTDNLGRVTGFKTVNYGGFVTAIKDARNNTTKINPSKFDNPLSVTHPDGSTQSFTRDDLDLVLTHTDELGRVTTYTRDANHRVTRIGYPDSSFETFAYNGFGQVTSHQLRNGATETTTYNVRGLAQSHTNAAGQTSAFAYDSLDRLASVTDANGHTMQFAYNDRGQITQITYADGSTYSYAYDTYGNKISETNEVGKTWAYTYDFFKRLTSMTDPLNRMTTFTYGGGYEAKPIAITLPSGKKTTFTYDAEWQTLSMTVGAGSPDAATTAYTYDNAGNVTSQTDPNGHAWSYAYDSRNRKTSQTDPLGHTTQYAYDAADNVTRITRPDGGATTNTYDTMHRLLSTTDPKGKTTTMTYDASGNLLSTTDARGNTYSFTYDALNRRTAMSYPDASQEQWSYDPAGNLATYTTRANQVCTYTYDSRNRNTQYAWSDSVTPTVTKTYDAASRLLTNTTGGTASSPSVTLSYTYDIANQLLSETSSLALHPSSFVVSYTYDLDGNRSTLTYPAGNIATYTYTGRNQTAGITFDDTSVATYAYDLAGQRVTKSLKNGTTASYSYDDASRLTNLAHVSGASALASFAYAYDAIDRRTSRAETSGTNTPATDTYTYDAIDQITGVTYGASARTVAYAYDATGNRTSVVDNASTTLYTANNLNQYITIDSLPALAYDPNGNLTSYTGWTYSYDAQNRLISVSGGPSSVTATFAYDARNRCVSRTLNGATTYYTYDGWSLIEEYGGTGSSPSQTYIHGAATDELLAMVTPSATHFYHQDALGSTVRITNATGAVEESYTYDVFGKVSLTDGNGNPLTSSAIGNRFLFTGREWLKDIGLYDYRNRVYSQDLGRFLQTDPIRFDAGDVNLYRYCGNDPVNWIDPLGLKISYHGFTPAELKQVHQIEKNIQKTKRGKQLFDSMRKNKKRDFKITKDCKGGPNYDPNTDEINFDPNFTTNIQTADGPTSASPERILGHEAGHAVTGTNNDGPNNMNNVNQNENPIATGLGQPPRTQY